MSHDPGPLGRGRRQASRRPGRGVRRDQLPGDVKMKNIGLPPGVVYACLAETVVLALEGRFETFAVGATSSGRRSGDLPARAQARHEARRHLPASTASSPPSRSPTSGSGRSQRRGGRRDPGWSRLSVARESSATGAADRIRAAGRDADRADGRGPAGAHRRPLPPAAGTPASTSSCGSRRPGRADCSTRSATCRSTSPSSAWRRSRSRA